MGVPKVDPDLCTGCGICEDVCPEVFQIGDDGLSHVIDPGACQATGCCEEAVDECPEGAITLKWSCVRPASVGRGRDIWSYRASMDG